MSAEKRLNQFVGTLEAFEGSGLYLTKQQVKKLREDLAFVLLRKQS